MGFVIIVISILFTFILLGLLLCVDICARWAFGGFPVIRTIFVLLLSISCIYVSIIKLIETLVILGVK